MKRSHVYLILMYFTCTWVIVGFLVWHYANHDHPTIIVEREKVCDCADELRDVSADLAVYKGMAQDMHALGKKMFNGLASYSGCGLPLTVNTKRNRPSRSRRPRRRQTKRRSEGGADEAHTGTRGCCEDAKVLL